MPVYIFHHLIYVLFFFFSSRRRHTRWTGDWSSDVCSSDLLLIGAPSERFTTCAPWSAAQRMPSATFAVVPQPCLLSTFTGMSVAQYARPATPFPLFVVCAIVPAMCVPWPWSSQASARSSTKFQPAVHCVP